MSWGYKWALIIGNAVSIGGGSVGPQMIFDPDDRIGYGGNGAVRIIWGAGRSFPNGASNN
jgi:hypothetical protein